MFGFIVFCIGYLVIGLILMKLLIMKFGIKSFQDIDYGGEADNSTIYLIVALWPLAIIMGFFYGIGILIKKVLGI